MASSGHRTALQPAEWLRECFRQARREPAQALLGAAVVAVAAYVILGPFLVVRYPPITDLPFHAAQTSILRHYLDPDFGFRAQFTLHPLEVPYLSMYALGAVLALVLPIAWATKLMAAAMLALLPIGLGVFFHGMKKSPLWAVLGLVPVWCTLTHWGFLNFLGAVGLFSMALGFALLVVDRPTRGRQLGLALTLVAVFFTHVYRFPFAVTGVLAAALLAYPATRRFRPVLWPLAPSAALFAVWWLVRSSELSAPLGEVSVSPERIREIPKHLFGAYLPPEEAPSTPMGDRERTLASQMLVTTAAAIGAAAILAWARRDRGTGRSISRRWTAAVTVLPVLGAAGLFLLYLTLPLEIGKWWYVYPREIVTAAFLLLGVAPELPQRWTHRLPILALAAIGPLRMTEFVNERWRHFEQLTSDFREIQALVPPAPRLHYLVFLRGGTGKRASPFLHLPAWIQAEKGGALGFHFVTWNHSPIRYRTASNHVPPPLPDRFEWTPQHFRVTEHGAFFDTFLVRHRIDPAPLFAPDPTIQLAARRGTWWLYRRQGAGSPAEPGRTAEGPEPERGAP